MILLVVLAAAGCGDSSDTSGAAAEVLPATQQTTSTPAALPLDNVDRDHPVIRVETNVGGFTLQLDAERARGTVQNFLNYVNDGFYKGTIFHFVIADKLVLGGGYTEDYQLKPTLGPIRNQAHNDWKNTRGTIAMARDPALRDSANSQFFINLEDAPQRDHHGDSVDEYGYCVFGEVTEGLDVVEKISRSATIDMSAKGGDLASTPSTPIVITSIQVVL